MARTKVYAHRGDPGKAPENTMAAFELAAALGADGIELDIQLTKDGKLAVIHDEMLGRTANGTGLVKDHDFDSLRTLDAGSWFSRDYAGEKIPLLDEVMELSDRHGMLLNIEIKSMPGKSNPGIEQVLFETIERYKACERVIVSSFNHYCLIDIKKLDKNIHIAPLYVAMFADIWEYAEKIGASALHPLYNTVTAELMAECAKRGIAVNAWTVDAEADMQRLFDLGVSGIISNKPDIAIIAAREAEKRSHAL